MATGIGLILLGYLVGSLSFSYWIVRILKGEDIRDSGSHHATTTNTIRQAGWIAGALVLILDIAKGFIPTYLAYRYTGADWAIALTGMAAIAGHCWPLYFGFRGGMGLATAGGAILTIYPLGLPIGMGILIAMTLGIRHSARASFVTGVLVAPVFYLAGARGIIILLALGLGLVIAIRFLGDWNREYQELWLDRDPTENN